MLCSCGHDQEQRREPPARAILLVMATEPVSRAPENNLATMARAARDTLKPVLRALQNDETLSPSVRDLAGQLAGAMNALFHIERTGTQPAGPHPVQASEAASPPIPIPPASPPDPRAAAPVDARRPSHSVHVYLVDLGLQSASNFYRGLAGDDVIEAGGLFVSTYMLPELGAPVRLCVRMPTGFEFEANGVVEWLREPREASPDTPPGFGAKVTAITEEVRKLIDRYVRRREPVFYDPA
jgi:hypothetical protein